MKKNWIHLFIKSVFSALAIFGFISAFLVAFGKTEYSKWIYSIALFYAGGYFLKESERYKP